MGGLASTMRFLQEENHRLLERGEELERENVYLHDTLKSIKGLVDTVARLDVIEDLDRLLNRIVYEAVRIVDAVEGSLLVSDPAAGELVFVAARSEMRDRLVGYRIPIDTGIAGWVVQHEEPVIANDVRQDDRFSSTVDQAFQFTTRSLLAVPLICCGQPLGAIELVNKYSDQPFNERDIETVSLLSPIAAMVIALASRPR
jgi:GAF domain-containing protein